MYTELRTLNAARESIGWFNSYPVEKTKKVGIPLQISSEVGLTWKKPGGMGPPGIPSPGGIPPITGLGAAAALWVNKTKKKKKKKKKEHFNSELKILDF